MIDVIDRALPAAKLRPVRCYSLHTTGGYLADMVLHLREWIVSDDGDEPPVESLYAVQEVNRNDHGWLGRVFLMLRVNTLPIVLSLYDDAEADEGRLFCVRVPPEYGDRRTPGDCDCKGYRTFARCSHLDAMRDAVRYSNRPAQKSEALTDVELESWVMGEA